METIQEVQKTLYEQTGLKTSVKKLKGSMKNYVMISAMFQNGNYPKFEFEYGRNFIKKFRNFGDDENGFSLTHFTLLIQNFTDLTPMKFKTEKKPKTIEEMKVREWGSKNSQMRLDKKSAAYAKKGRQGRNQARYY